ncbi:Glycosyltransferase involved in cell wall bisynthesis [Eubacterium maltosivorans]|uniref:glycosyltransferase n=1 Tax=Eubacterium maltosivorans TaxID=2041044 RepID=UPI00088D0C45|nr:glycosyltransferase [Eubacterium maltosivorans]WPK79447.1 hypothetical protein EUMA32_08540 [Eubacterium maltosivorans]SDP40559.1 Glycosyltransferase involved in cell wall bisynthesis [Eubacterium maltosivorans]
MKNKKICFLYKHIIMGGAETLILRLSEWYVLHNYEVEIVCKSINKEIEDSFIKKNIVVKKLFAFSAKAYLKTINKEIRSKEYLFITFGFYDYFLSEKIRIKNRNLKISNLWYVVHPFHTRIEKSLIFFAKPVLKKTIIKLYNSNRIFFMDEDCIRITEEYYKINLDNSYERIIRLPLFINKQQKIKNKQKDFLNILSIARFEFPFKGYLIGLIKDFNELNQNNRFLKLTIIGDGKGMLEIKDTISKLPPETQKNICIEGIVPYEKLKNYFEDADIYIGMGTTVLDACNYMVPALTVYSYTYEFLTIGFFYENPQIVAGFSKQNSIVDKKGIAYVEKVLKMGNVDYQKLCIESYRAFSDMYDINNNAPKFLEVNTNKEKTVQNLIIINIFFIIRNGIELLRKLKRKGKNN